VCEGGGAGGSLWSDTHLHTVADPPADTHVRTLLISCDFLGARAGVAGPGVGEAGGGGGIGDGNGGPGTGTLAGGTICTGTTGASAAS
jgi:hypothetical protein